MGVHSHLFGLMMLQIIWGLLMQVLYCLTEPFLQEISCTATVAHLTLGVATAESRTGRAKADLLVCSCLYFLPRDTAS